MVTYNYVSVVARNRGLTSSINMTIAILANIVHLAWCPYIDYIV